MAIMVVLRRNYSKVIIGSLDIVQYIDVYTVIIRLSTNKLNNCPQVSDRPIRTTKFAKSSLQLIDSRRLKNSFSVQVASALRPCLRSLFRR
jgi:hypothetical protein